MIYVTVREMVWALGFSLLVISVAFRQDVRAGGMGRLPEHVHLLVSEPERGLLATAIQAIKQSVARRLSLRKADPFWQARYYDFNVWSEYKRIEKLKYMHRNPVKRGLVARPEDWVWSSFLHFATGREGIVEIESAWTARRRERWGLAPELIVRRRCKIPTRAKEARVGHPPE